jgi:hypothetical protein
MGVGKKIAGSKDYWGGGESEALGRGVGKILYVGYTSGGAGEQMN